MIPAVLEVVVHRTCVYNVYEAMDVGEREHRRWGRQPPERVLIPIARHEKEEG